MTGFFYLLLLKTNVVMVRSKSLYSTQQVVRLGFSKKQNIHVSSGLLIFGHLSLSSFSLSLSLILFLSLSLSSSSPSLYLFLLFLTFFFLSLCLFLSLSLSIYLSPSFFLSFISLCLFLSLSISFLFLLPSISPKKLLATHLPNP